MNIYNNKLNNSNNTILMICLLNPTNKKQKNKKMTKEISIFL